MLNFYLVVLALSAFLGATALCLRKNSCSFANVMTGAFLGLTSGIFLGAALACVALFSFLDNVNLFPA